MLGTRYTSSRSYTRQDSTMALSIAKNIYARETANVSSLEGILILNRLVSLNSYSLNSYTLDTCLQLGLSTQWHVNMHRQLLEVEKHTTIYKVEF